ncbi:hypothetical protein Taro_006428 [Colocasia esculenta]|uniref:Uncharacterized protein n=1 Tax=Colocasia esculenta TaxID=4460 RepID=A0A843TX04_COLES|nr:hypothetical protein [Colocasia esculenta]
MKEKETSKANITRRRQEIREELSAPPRRSVDEIHLSRGRQTIDLDDDEEEQFRRTSQASRRSFAEEDYLRRTGHHLGQGSGHVSSGQGSSSAGMSTNIPEVLVDIPRDGDPRVGPLDPFLTRRREKQPSISAAFKNLKICKEKIGRATSRCIRDNRYRRSFEEEHPLHAWVNATTSVEPEFDPHDRAWAEGELDDVPLLPEFATPPAPKHQKKTVGARVRSKKHDISIADLETIKEDNDDETLEPSDNLVYRTSNDSTSKTSTPSEGSDHRGDVSSVPPPAPPPYPMVFTGEEDFTHATQDQHHGSRQRREA